MSVIVQIGYGTSNDRLLPLISSRDPLVVGEAARHILAGLPNANFEDNNLNVLANLERNHLIKLLGYSELILWQIRIIRAKIT